MVLPAKIAEALHKVHALVKAKNGIHILHTSEITRADRELLLRTEWLEEIIAGWYMLVRPDSTPGDSTAWYANFWDFLNRYLEHRFGKNYCLSAESSIDLHIGSCAIPDQIVAIANKASGAPVKLPFSTSIYIYARSSGLPEEHMTLRGINVMPLEYALCKVSPSYFQTAPEDAQIALRSISDPSNLVRVIVQYNLISAAQRLMGAYEFLGNKIVVDQIQRSLKEVGISVRPINPFKIESPYASIDKIYSPHALRIKAMWEKYRKEVIAHFPQPNQVKIEVSDRLMQIEELYTQDAYHSLSIEGYQVTEGLIEKVRESKWSPDKNWEDLQQRNALAARGYFEAFECVKESIEKILKGDLSGDIIQKDLPYWYQKLFGPCVRAGLFSQSDLFGYRRTQVYIRNSRHTPPVREALMDCMEMLFYCLKEEPHPAVRAILGHFIFVYIHPYMDGNGRIARFLMNTMLVSGGYPWTIVHVQDRNTYFKALEAASVGGTIIPFTKFIVSQPIPKSS